MGAEQVEQRAQRRIEEVVPLRRELAQLGRLALPIALTQLALMAMGVVDMLMVGRVSVEAVGAVALGNLWKMGTLIGAMGVVFGMDPLVSQAHGAGDGRRAGLALQRGVVLALLLSLPLAALWWQTGAVLVLLGQDPAIAAVAGRYLHVQLPSLPLFLAWVALREYLQCRGIVRPTLWIALAGNALNAALNWILIFGNLGAPALGAVGSGVATSVIQGLLPVATLAYVLRARLHEGAWVPWSRAAVAPRALLEILRLGGPVGLALLFEAWCFQILTLWSGWLGKEQLAAHSFVLNMASASFMVPLGVSLAAVTRVGNLLGGRRPRSAQRAAYVALAIGAGSMAVFALLFVLLRHELPRLYTTDRLVVDLAATILPIAAAFQLFDGTQVVGGGVLRGMGRTRPAALFQGAGLYAIGLPLAWWLAFPRGLGLVGLWWGLAIGLAIVALAFVLWIWRRGPARMEP